ncbi:Oxidoreductase BOA1 [Colletotrichum orbiculare MAFF 240422]|uniref:Oxidoreductase BOA1 n=1 Tax=Colletotrichum orbiculare (strain 104-T / ATCC 96160 / CBS 514.97 / LARS 414 / MAFF 240422) TaxID=1213857 RepID=N4UVK4_COLOR|nr:Oxidoreductase BOA1 [Colletotrichum orbiculare MAFF 240422]
MVYIAVAGGSGMVGQEIIDALVAKGKHQIVLLSRKDAPRETLPDGVKWTKTTYDVAHLVEVLRGVDTVLSFVAGPADPTNKAQEDTQKNLIDAAIQAGVRRFAPSEWASAGFDHMFWYNYKSDIRNYLIEVNKDKKVLEYTLFQPGIFTNYLTYPFKSAKRIQQLGLPFNYHERHAVIVDGHEDAKITLTTVQDLARIVAVAVEHEQEWPRVSGMNGGNLTIRQVIELGEKVRGGPFTVEKLKAEDVKAGVLKTSRVSKATHPSIPEEEREAAAPVLMAGILMGFSSGVFEVSDEWNRLLPDYKFTQPEDFLTKAWAEIDAGATEVSIEV